MPPLTVMSLSVRSIVNHHDNKQEIVCTTSRTWQNRGSDIISIPCWYSLTLTQCKLTIQPHLTSSLVVFRRLSGHWIDFLQTLRLAREPMVMVSYLLLQTRRWSSMNSYVSRHPLISPRSNHIFVGEVYKMDPDVIIGHEFLGVSLDILLHRMKFLKVNHWSRLGRFRRSKWPNIGRQGSNLRFLNGRMLCDLASDGAKVSWICHYSWT